MNEPQYFTPAFLKFYKDLAANNDRDWFQANRGRYEKSVKLPFEGFVTELIEAMKLSDPALDLQTKDAIFRINRDVRFSKDKTPYKLCSSAIISKGGKKDHVSPGLYVELGPEKVAVYGGVYMPDKEQLQAIRNHIAGHLEEFGRLLIHDEFVSSFGTLHGERNKIISPDLRPMAERQPLLYNKAFYFYAHLPAETVLQKDIISRVTRLYEAGRPMADFLYTPLK
jgi:uncharacterized protein (TIGR02453 family)